ncbi:MAG: hypothetical protein ACYDD1_00545 [Caulobacteraceae bacterium]
MRDWLTRPWFASKGYGFAAPTTWEAWVLVAAFIFALSLAAWLPRTFQAADFVLALSVFIIVCALKTDVSMRRRRGASNN